MYALLQWRFKVKPSIQGSSAVLIIDEGGWFSLSVREYTAGDAVLPKDIANYKANYIAQKCMLIIIDGSWKRMFGNEDYKKVLELLGFLIQGDAIILRIAHLRV